MRNDLMYTIKVRLEEMFDPDDIFCTVIKFVKDSSVIYVEFGNVSQQTEGLVAEFKMSEPKIIAESEITVKDLYEMWKQKSIRFLEAEVTVVDENIEFWKKKHQVLSEIMEYESVN